MFSLFVKISLFLSIMSVVAAAPAANKPLVCYGGTGLVNGNCQPCLPGQAQDYGQWTVPCHTCLTNTYSLKPNALICKTCKPGGIVTYNPATLGGFTCSRP